MDHELERAFSAYIKSDGPSAEQPIAACSGVRQLDGLRYVVLANRNRVCGVYRVRRNGALRRMRRWPMALGSVSDKAIRSTATTTEGARL